jgi:hypothetical protein
MTKGEPHFPHFGSRYIFDLATLFLTPHLEHARTMKSSDDGTVFFSVYAAASVGADAGLFSSGVGVSSMSGEKVFMKSM